MVLEHRSLWLRQIGHFVALIRCFDLTTGQTQQPNTLQWTLTANCQRPSQTRDNSEWAVFYVPSNTV